MLVQKAVLLVIAACVRNHMGARSRLLRGANADRRRPTAQMETCATCTDADNVSIRVPGAHCDFTREFFVR